VGFYKLMGKELISRDRKIIIKINDEKGAKFVHDFSNNSSNATEKT
jgi:hypothetical protein